MLSSIGTLLQYEAAIKRELFSDREFRRETSRAEYDQCYPTGSRLGEWLDDIRGAARRGETLRRATLDDLALREGERFIRSLVHDYPTLLPKGYFLPSVRRWNLEREQEWAAARKRGRERWRQP